MVASDTIALIVALVVAATIEFGFYDVTGHIYSAILLAGWLTFLSLGNSRDPVVIGNGIEEYRRVFVAAASLIGALAVVLLLLQGGFARRYALVAFPLGLLLQLIGRGVLRRRLARNRSRGNDINDVIVIGSIESVTVMSARFDGTMTSGYRVVGACIPGADRDTTIVVGDRIIPFLGDGSAIEDALVSTRVSAVAVSSVDTLGFARMRGLCWLLDEYNVDLVVSAGVADMSISRMRISPIDGVPLLHIGQPKFEGAHVAAKTVFDFVLTLVSLIFVVPILLIAAAAIKLEDGGPVFFRQKRVGRGGRIFRIWKLRTMIVDADSAVSSAKKLAGQSDSVFYKAANDARITNIGRFLRRTSIDELPQLFNVLGGDMSIVGPRPLVEGEGAEIENFIARRGLVKPGVTGLWQVSGRSDVAEEERIRLDHFYIDNWSPVQDLSIIVRTVAAVLKSDGAY